jgi:hypothetical protein
VSDELAIVGTFRRAYQAEIARSALEAYGLPAWILTESRVRHYVSRNVKLAVRAADAELARELLAGDHSADLDAVEFAPEPGRSCPACGTTHSEASAPGAIVRCGGCGRQL